jgi:SAM-dependent methyltransferase
MESSSFIDSLTSLDPVLKIQARRLQRSLSESDRLLYSTLEKYICEYCQFYKMSSSSVISAHMRFLERYMADLKAFAETGLYPFACNPLGTWDRVDYDIALMLSTLLVQQRFQIMKKLSEIENCGPRSLIIGLGPGLELELLKDKEQKIDAYDISLSAFCKAKHSASENLRLFEKKFSHSADREKYDTIYAIELLEHLEDPIALLKDLADSLQPGGQMILTTARNLPQFDHLYNFTEPAVFERQCQDLGLSVVEKELIPHNYKMLDIAADNTFFVFRKD